MFVDKAKIYIKAGDGGDGAVSFRREKYVPSGGPDGGDGGEGGSVAFEVDEGMRTLMDFKYERKFVATSGEKGKKKNMRGKNGEMLVIKVPPGTVIKDFETGRVAADMRQGQRELLLGGGGGKGNSRFASSTRQNPRFATPGRKCKGRFVTLELKSIADVGLIGFPNVGKSTLLAASTSAKPKIAGYHFTTLKPNLGVVGISDFSFVMADIPGLIEGASEGAGLGHDFLRHIERTRMLIHVVDASCVEGRDIVDDYEAIRAELINYSDELLERPEIVAANKMDIEGADENVKKLEKHLKSKGVEVFPISAAIGEGTKELMQRAAAVLKELPIPEPIVEDGMIEEWALERDAKEYEVYRQDGVFFVDGTIVQEILARTNPDDPDSLRHFQKLLKDFGIIKTLRREGAKTGDTVCLEGMEFDFVD
ncbi:MAG: GTPase ObgE [Clostridia bacterium]|jgi:GTPase|nr:GTPase ObgE [Clostridia bacterium]